MGFFAGFGAPGEGASSCHYHVRLPRRARTFAKVSKDAFVFSHNKPSHARADLSWPGYASLTLAFCFATRCCMNLGLSFSLLVKVDAGGRQGQTRHWLQENSRSTALREIWGSGFDRKFVRTWADGGLVSVELILWPRKHLGYHAVPELSPRPVRAFVPAEPKISEHILCPLSHISSNLHVRTLRISEPRFALPRQQLIPISS